MFPILLHYFFIFPFLNQLLLGSKNDFSLNLSSFFCSHYSSQGKYVYPFKSVDITYLWFSIEGYSSIYLLSFQFLLPNFLGNPSSLSRLPVTISAILAWSLLSSAHHWWIQFCLSFTCFIKCSKGSFIKVHFHIPSFCFTCWHAFIIRPKKLYPHTSLSKCSIIYDIK